MNIDSKLQELYKAALRVSTASYCPYSNFPVGAALLCEDGYIVLGTNVENRSYGLTICAERTAIFTYQALGGQSAHGPIKALAIAAPKASYPVGPCGACRQVVSEFCPPSTPIVFGPNIAKLTLSTIGELLPLDSLHELSTKQHAL